MATYRGTTEQGQALPPQNQAPPPFINAGWWKPGVTVCGIVTNTGKNDNGSYFEMRMVKPESVLVGEKTVRVVRVSFYVGLWLAMRALREVAKDKRLRVQIGDQLYIKCTGITPPKEAGHSPSPNFEVEIDRPDGGEEMPPEGKAI